MKRERIDLRVSQAEKEAWEAEAKRLLGKDRLSEWIRRVCNRALVDRGGS